MTTITDEDRTTAIGLANYAGQFLRAADATAKAELERTGKVIEYHAPAYFLVLHSIELSLKAYLRSTGLTLAELVSRVRHNVQSSLDEANKKGLGAIFEQQPDDPKTLRLLIDMNEKQALRYQRSGSFESPSWSTVRSFALRLYDAVSKHVGWFEVEAEQR